MIDTTKVREWEDVYIQSAALHAKDSKMFGIMLANYKRVFQRKLDRFGNDLQDLGKEIGLTAAKQNESKNLIQSGCLYYTTK